MARRMSEEDILKALEDNISTGVGYFDTKLSTERETVLKYYHGALPLPNHAGNSKYVSMDVYDTVESAKAQILEVFSAGQNIVEFTPNGPEDVELAKQASAYTDYVVFQQNDGYGIFSDIIQDGLLARVGVAKVYWEDLIEESDEEVDVESEDDLVVLLSDDNVELNDLEIDPETQTAKATLTRKVDKSQVRIEPIAPEEFLISPRAIDIPSALFSAHRAQKTQGELIAEGFDPKIVKKLKKDDTWTWDTEKQARLNQLSFDRSSSEIEYAESARPITVHECYIMLDVDKTGKPKLWKVIKADKIILDMEQVDKVPFIPFVPLPIPHSFFGQNYAKLCIPIQNARTVLMRGVLDHTVRTNNPRTIVVKGGLVNPREMLDNRIGGLVNVTRPDAISPEQQAPLNPFVFETIKLLDEDKEDATGVSKLSQGLNKDAVSKQNSASMIENLVSLSMVRQKIIARNFANKFIVPLYLEVYRLVLMHEKKSKIVEVAGKYVPMDPTKWEERTDARVALKLGYGEQEKEANETLGLHTLFSQDPSVLPMYDMQKRRNLLTKYLNQKGCKNVDDYLLKPEEVQPPPPDPKIELEKRALDIEESKVNIAQMTAQHKAQMDQLNHSLARMQEMMDVMMSQREQERKDFDSKTKAEVAHRELDIIESQPATETKQTNVVSPNS
jgi:hypothetical protein